MASVSVSHMILFIASMIIAASVAGVFTTSVDQLADAIDDQGLQVSDNVRTSIDVISDSGADEESFYDEDQVIVLVKNTGTNELTPEASHVDVLVNGEFKTVEDVTVEHLGDGATWSPNEVVRLVVDHPGLDNGDHRVTVIVNNDEDVFEFRLEEQ